MERAASGAGAFQIGEMTAVGEHGQAGVGNGLRDMGGAGDDVSLALGAGAQRLEAAFAERGEIDREAGAGFIRIQCDTRSGWRSA